VLDTRRSIETPEGVELALRVAGPIPRALAWMLDAAIRSGIYMALSIPLGLLGSAGLGFFFLALFLGEWFYPVLFEVFRRGATPGKAKLGIRVLHADGTPVGWTASMIRNLVRFADFLPLLYGFGIVSMLVDRDSRRLGDLAAGTLVVHAEEPTVGAAVPDVPPLPPPVPLRPDEQRAIIEYAERLGSWTSERQVELANLARPLTGATGRGGVQRLVGMASWIVGHR
jgi:uncharacterized RDD family membrane protein YckC